MSIINIETIRDCGTAAVIIKGEDGEMVEYLIHGNNWGNARIDVTKGGWRNQEYPTPLELQYLHAQLISFEFQKSPLYVGWEKTPDEILHLNRHAHELAGMVRLFLNHLDNTSGILAPPKAEPVRDIVEEITTKLVDQLQESMLDDIFATMAEKYKEGHGDVK